MGKVILNESPERLLAYSAVTSVMVAETNLRKLWYL